MIKNLKNARSNKDCTYCKTDICIRHMKFEKPEKGKKMKNITPNSYAKWLRKNQNSYLYSLEDYRFGFLIDRINQIIDYINKHE